MIDQLFGLKGKVAIVTGGNGGLGIEMAQGLIKAGASVAIWARNEEKNKKAIASLGPNAKAFACDVTNAEDCKKAFEATLAHFGRADICVANAGGAGKSGHFTNNTKEDWKQIMDLNVNGVINTFQAIIPHLIKTKEGGKLIVTSSIAGLMGMPYASGYGTTKAAVLGLMRSLALELGRHQIQVNAILPGYIPTDMSIKTPQEFKDGVKRRSASGRDSTPDQIQGITIFLSSPASNLITGQSIVIDDGHTLYPM
jgi:NAD(P)-dependent dehydrogenase (short-subunit alcohol dehydrogenase family)